MKRKLKRSTKQYIIVAIITVIIIGTAFCILYFTVVHNMRQNYQKQIKFLSDQLNTHKFYVYEAKELIPAGCKIKRSNLNHVQVYSNQSSKIYMTEKDIGKTALIPISKGMQIVKGMLTEQKVDGNVREVEYNSFSINSNLNNNDSIDIRIRYPNGEDYIVISKKNIKSINQETSNCFLWLSEEEILNMSAAIVDAYLYSGTSLYTVKYIEPSLQEASIVTYQPNSNIITLIEKDPNIVERASGELNRKLRNDLERHLEDFLNKDGVNSEQQTLSGTENMTRQENMQNNDSYSNQTSEDYFLSNKSEEKEVSVEYGE